MGLMGFMGFMGFPSCFFVLIQNAMDALFPQCGIVMNMW